MESLIPRVGCDSSFTLTSYADYMVSQDYIDDYISITVGHVTNSRALPNQLAAVSMTRRRGREGHT